MSREKRIPENECGVHRIGDVDVQHTDWLGRTVDLGGKGGAESPILRWSEARRYNLRFTA
jgi:hypothetical protein